MVKKIFDNIVLFSFLFSSLLLGGFIVAGYSLRIYISIISLIYLLVNFYKFKFNIEVYLFIFFILIFFIVINYNGQINGFDFFKYFFGRYFICIIAFYLINSLVRNKNDIKNIIFFYLFVGFFNLIVSYLQFVSNDIGYQIPVLLNNSDTSKEMFEFYSSYESGLGFGTVGVFGNIVKNGYFSGVFAAMGMYFVLSSKKTGNKAISILLFLLLIVNLFFTQQRFITILFLLLLIIYFIKNHKIYVILGSVIFIVVLRYYNFKEFDTTQVGRFSNLKDESRVRLLDLSVSFIKDNFWLGGQHNFETDLSENGFRITSAHNFFLNSFIYSGIFGFILMSILYLKMVIFAFRNFLKKSDSLTLVLSYVLILYLLNSLTHNSSLLTGEEFIWIMFVLLLKSISIDKKNKIEVNNENTMLHR